MRSGNVERKLLSPAALMSGWAIRRSLGEGG